MQNVGKSSENARILSKGKKNVIFSSHFTFYQLTREPNKKFLTAYFQCYLGHKLRKSQFEKFLMLCTFFHLYSHRFFSSSLNSECQTRGKFPILSILIHSKKRKVFFYPKKKSCSNGVRHEMMKFYSILQPLLILKRQLISILWKNTSNFTRNWKLFLQKHFFSFFVLSFLILSWAL